ncbi:tRNA pseudouridine(55) synthase TruB [Candidatus Falkowbacteria bacterium]|nr:tRNA pseudouridine(55) synthase TruB [Candidatus Falkowbacteria bacterium]
MAAPTNQASKPRIFGVYKPVGPTSHDIVNRIRRVTGEKRVGHAGTLDPLACGVLVVAVGRESTKQLQAIVESEKEYVAGVRIGQGSTTDDAEGDKSDGPIIDPPSVETINEVLQKFVGEIEQVPPAYSAIKVGGKTAYKMARKGQALELRARTVLIKEIELLGCEWPELSIRVVTGPGTYIRSLARDIGEALGTKAYMSSLERTRVGQFRKEDAIPVEEIMMLSSSSLEEYLKN